MSYKNRHSQDTGALSKNRAMRTMADPYNTKFDNYFPISLFSLFSIHWNPITWAAFMVGTFVGERPLQIIACSC